jgi:predicted PurR-regulated permease PerM
VIAGLPTALFRGTVMMLLSLLPVFGAFLVWVPASLFLVVGGLVVFGPAGLIIGPCLIAVAAGLADVWRARSIEVPLENRAMVR